jgi:uncharacterized membrane protein YvbJ
MRCTSCGSENPTAKRFCGECGTPVDSDSPKCGVQNAAGKKFCGDCGTALAINSMLDERSVNGGGC